MTIGEDFCSNIVFIDVEILSGMEERCIELLIDAIVRRQDYKIKDENVLKAIGNILKKLSENPGVKQIIEVDRHTSLLLILIEFRCKAIPGECRCPYTIIDHPILS